MVESIWSFALGLLGIIVVIIVIVLLLVFFALSDKLFGD
jgi:hypothetical protein